MAWGAGHCRGSSLGLLVGRHHNGAFVGVPTACWPQGAGQGLLEACPDKGLPHITLEGWGAALQGRLEVFSLGKNQIRTLTLPWLHVVAQNVLEGRGRGSGSGFLSSWAAGPEPGSL